MAAMGSKLFFSVPAVGAEIFLRNARGFEHIVEAEVCEGGEAQLFADLCGHLLILLAIRINIFADDLLGGGLALKLGDHAAGNQLKLRRRAREVQVLTAEQDGGTARTDVNLLGTAVVEELCGFSELGTAHDGVVDEQELLSLDQLVDRNELHLCDQIAFVLMGGHEGTGPGRRIFNEGSCEFHGGFVRITDGVCDTGVGNTRNEIGLDHALISLGKAFAAVITHFFNGHAFVRGGRIAVVDPKEGTDLHLIVGTSDRADAVFVHDDDLARLQRSVIRVTEVEIREAFGAGTEAVLLFADEDGCSAVLIAHGVNALGREDEHAHGAVDDLLCIPDTFDEIILLVDDGGNELGLVDLTVLHFKEMRVILENCLYDFFRIVDFTYGRNAEGAVVGTDQDRLRLVVGDTANAVFAEHFVRFLLEFGTKRRVFYIMNGFLKSVFLAVNSHTRTAGTEVRMVVYTVK